jgi:serine/threonine protein kinase
VVNNQGEALIIDFGLSREQEPAGQTLSSSFGGTPRWMAPELIGLEPENESEDSGEAERQYRVPRLTFDTDVWASSMTVLEVPATAFTPAGVITHVLDLDLHRKASI